MMSISERVVNHISSELSIDRDRVSKIISLLQSGNTPPFIARYRKEVTGSLDEDKIYNIKCLLKYYTQLEDRKQEIKKILKEQGDLTGKLEEKISACLNKNELEDIYLPYKSGYKNKAKQAYSAGLEPLARLMLTRQDITSGSIEDYVLRYLNPQKGVNTVSDACRDAQSIISSWISRSVEVRQMVRRISFRMGTIVTKVKEEYANKHTKYETYYNHSEPVKTIPAHRILAINRAEREGIITVSIETPSEFLIEMIRRRFIRNPESIFRPCIESAIIDSFNNYIFPSVEKSIRDELTENACMASSAIFARNLKAILLQPPAKDKVVLGVDPGSRTGSKVAVVDKSGNYLAHAVIYPIEPMNKREESDNILKSLLLNFGVDVIAIGGNAESGEIGRFIEEMLQKNKLNMTTVIVNESGASAYSISKVAKEELPTLVPGVRKAVSIARRLQDPLAELVKVDPKFIGVGQYQHDVDQDLLSSALEMAVESVVNFVGVDLNTAGYSLLKYVSGIGPTLAKEIINYRNEHGKFEDLQELLNVPGFGEKEFEQSAGFLRIRDGRNPLDNSAIHPESYSFVYQLCASRGVSLEELIGNEELIDTLDPQELVTEKIGLPTVLDILKELKNPGQDPRKDFSSAFFSPQARETKDLTEGMILDGIVTNITDFGVFVDIGTKHDGLVHVSEITNKFVHDLANICKVGERVRVRVIAVDKEHDRISLSMRQAKDDK